MITEVRNTQIVIQPRMNGIPRMNGVALLCRMEPASMPMKGMTAYQPVGFLTPLRTAGGAPERPRQLFRTHGHFVQPAQAQKRRHPCRCDGIASKKPQTP